MTLYKFHSSQTLIFVYSRLVIASLPHAGVGVGVDPYLILN